MAFRYLTAWPSIDPDVFAFCNSVQGNGGTVSDARVAVLRAFVAAEKAAGLWALTDDYLGFWAESAAQALTSLKQRRLATVTAAPTFTQDRDYTTNGSSSYIDTGFIPATHAAAMTVASQHIEIYERTNVTGNTVAIGSTVTTPRHIRVLPRNAGSALGGAGTNDATFTLPAATSAGLTQIGRNGSLVTDVYGAKNGVDMVRSADPTQTIATLPSGAFFIGCYNSTGTPTAFRAGAFGYAAWGGALNATQRLARYTNVQAWATAVGAQV